MQREEWRLNRTTPPCTLIPSPNKVIPKSIMHIIITKTY